MGIGGSNAGVICGLTPYSTVISVGTDKIRENINYNDNEAMGQGRYLNAMRW